jgi:hypothetical protein
MVWKKFSRHAEAFKLDLGAMSSDLELMWTGLMEKGANHRILKNIAVFALMVGALIGSVGTSDAQYYRSYNNPYGPAYHGAYRSQRAMAPMPSQRGSYTNWFDNQPNAGDHRGPKSTFPVFNWGSFPVACVVLAHRDNVAFLTGQANDVAGIFK